MYRQTSPGLYVPASVDPTIVEQRILEQGSRIRTYGAVTGWAALRWRGARFFDGTTDGGSSELAVPLVVGHHKLRPDPRVSISQAQIAPSEFTQTGGIRCATVQRALFDEMRTARGRRLAVIAMDKAAAAKLISVRLMGLYVVERSGWTGVEQVREALALASDRSRSPQETALRLVWEQDAGLARPECNVPVFSSAGKLLGYPDLLDVEAGMVGEYEGEDHKDGPRHRNDVAREQLFRDHGLEYFSVVGGDLLQSVDGREPDPQHPCQGRVRSRCGATLDPDSAAVVGAGRVARPLPRPDRRRLDARTILNRPYVGRDARVVQIKIPVTTARSAAT